MTRIIRSYELSSYFLPPIKVPLKRLTTIVLLLVYFQAALGMIESRRSCGGKRVIVSSLLLGNGNDPVSSCAKECGACTIESLFGHPATPPFPTEASNLPPSAGHSSNSLISKDLAAPSLPIPAARRYASPGAGKVRRAIFWHLYVPSEYSDRSPTLHVVAFPRAGPTPYT